MNEKRLWRMDAKKGSEMPTNMTLMGTPVCGVFRQAKFKTFETFEMVINDWKHWRYVKIILQECKSLGDSLIFLYKLQIISSHGSNIIRPSPDKIAYKRIPLFQTICRLFLIQLIIYVTHESNCEQRTPYDKLLYYLYLLVIKHICSTSNFYLKFQFQLFHFAWNSISLNYFSIRTLAQMHNRNGMVKLNQKTTA